MEALRLARLLDPRESYAAYACMLHAWLLAATSWHVASPQKECTQPYRDPRIHSYRYGGVLDTEVAARSGVDSPSSPNPPTALPRLDSKHLASTV